MGWCKIADQWQHCELSLEEKAWIGVCALICGVTVDRDVMKVRKQNTEKEFVMHRSTLKKHQLPATRDFRIGIDCVRTTP